MFTLLKALRSRHVYLSEPVSMVLALVIAEVFYKFHSFLLETGAFLITWFVLGAIAHRLAAWAIPDASAEPRSIP
ncbi:MAG: hypothetical protein EXQ95_09310 [Alphaproteobacteria bacterium]|nr:hypothetical protein [Alphaproteobacteria bacterium]